jgi:ribonuclease BN (tRNA processing enzyme)
MLRFTPLGTGDAFCSGQKLQTCFYLEAGNFHILVDAGATAPLGLQQGKVATAHLDAILITHLHGDHFAGIPFLLLKMHYIDQRKRPLAIWGPGEVGQRLEQLMQLLYPGHGLVQLNFEIQVHQYSTDQEFEVGPFTVLPFGVDHSEAAFSHGLRLEVMSKVWVYSGDTRWTDRLIRASEGSDMMVVDCNFFTYQASTHLDYLTLTHKQGLLSTKRLVLTHLGEEMWANTTKIELEILQPLTTYTI